MIDDETRAKVREAMARAGEAARCLHREGPFGLYLYGSDESPVWHVRDFRDTGSASYGATVFKSGNRDEADAEYKRLTTDHIYNAALTAALPLLREAMGPKWEPIETCPSDAKWIWVCGGSWHDCPAIVHAEGDFWRAAIAKGGKGPPRWWMPIEHPAPPVLDALEGE